MPKDKSAKVVGEERSLYGGQRYVCIAIERHGRRITRTWETDCRGCGQMFRFESNCTARGMPGYCDECPLEKHQFVVGESFDFGSPPQRYQCIDIEPYTRRDGVETGLAIVTTECFDCGEKVAFRSTLKVRARALRRRCDRHKWAWPVRRYAGDAKVMQTDASGDADCELGVVASPPQEEDLDLLRGDAPDSDALKVMRD